MIGDMNARVGNNRVITIVGTNGEATLNNNSNKLIDFYECNSLKRNICFKYTEIHKLPWEPTGHKSVIDYFITHVKTSKVIQDITVYRCTELDTNRYLLRAT
jgi:hypothetical protein